MAIVSAPVTSSAMTSGGMMAEPSSRASSTLWIFSPARASIQTEVSMTTPATQLIQVDVEFDLAAKGHEFLVETAVPGPCFGGSFPFARQHLLGVGRFNRELRGHVACRHDFDINALRQPKTSDQRKRIDARSLHAHPPMQVRRGDAAGGADEADDLAVRHDLAALYVDAREVRVERDDSESVVEDHRVSGEEEVLR